MKGNNLSRPDEEFVNAIRVGLVYWDELTQKLDDEKITQLDGQRNNLFQLLEFGLRLPQTWEITAKILTQLYPLYDRRGYWKDGQIMLERAKSFCPNEFPSLQIRLNNQIGNFYRLQANIDKAKEIHENTLLAARKQKDPELLAICLISLLYDCRVKGHLEDAKRYGLEALSLLKEREDMVIYRIDGLRGVGHVFIQQGAYEEAQIYLEDAVKLARSCGETVVLARTLMDFIDLLTKVDDEALLLACIEESKNLLQETVYDLDRVTLSNRIGIFYFQQKNWGMAELAFREAIESLSRLVGYVELQTILFNNLGNVLLNQGKLSEAEIYLKASLKQRPQIGDEVGWANTEGTLAKLYVKNRKKSDALNLYGGAIEKLQRYPDNVWAKELLRKFRREVHENWGDGFLFTTLDLKE